MQRKKPLKVFIFGICGKMGTSFISISKTHNIEIVGGFDIIKHQTFPTYSEIDEIENKFDIILDCSSPDLIHDVLFLSKKLNKPICIATTSHTPSQINEIKNSSKRLPIFYSTNMSYGASILLYLLKKSLFLINDEYDIEIIEKHHNKKIDTPSGTAKTMYNIISQKRKNYYILKNHCGKRIKEEIGIHSIRGGSIVGEHEVLFIGNDEIISIKHEAFSRDIFAIGFVKAINFLTTKKLGLYDMDDLINEMEKSTLK